jgi:AcrR family transcriptional regulator
MIYLSIGMKSEIAAAPRGRPRAFNPDAVLERAMHVFWAKGYEGASLSDLTRAMRINRPSLYAAFGNKEQLFRKVLDRYMDGPVAYFGKALAAAKAPDVVEEILLGTARMGDDPRIPAGCLMVQGALACGDASVRKEVAARRAAAEGALRRRLHRAKREGDLPKNADPVELAGYVMTVVRGMAVQSAGGASSDQLRRVAQIALRAVWCL